MQLGDNLLKWLVKIGTTSVLESQRRFFGMLNSDAAQFE